MLVRSRRTDDGSPAFECPNFEQLRDSFKNSMIRNYDKWTYVKSKLVKNYATEFIDFVKSINLERL